MLNVGQAASSRRGSAPCISPGLKCQGPSSAIDQFIATASSNATHIRPIVANCAKRVPSKATQFGFARRLLIIAASLDAGDDRSVDVILDAARDFLRYHDRRANL